MPPLRTILNPLRQLKRSLSTSSKPRHLLSIADLTPTELQILVNNASIHQQHLRSSKSPLKSSLLNQVIAMPFSKRSTRTRVSTEGAITMLGGHPMFLGSGDIQLGVNESLYDTSVVISSMVSGIVARVGPHSDIAGLAKDSSVPVINALCDTFHPMQILADFATISQHIGHNLKGLKIAWVGDANNVLYDMLIGATKLGIDMAVATPKGYEIPAKIKGLIREAQRDLNSPGKRPGSLFETNTPEEAVKGANIIVTDTWVSMGQEEEKAERLKAFEDYQVTEEMAKRGGAAKDWKFMHCLPRHSDEVSDEVFYGKRSLVFPEAENRLWAAISALEGFVVNKGDIKKTELGL